METFTCPYCQQARREAEQPPLLRDRFGWRCCTYCAGSRHDLCNCCGVRVSGYAVDSPIHICDGCRNAIGWNEGWHDGEG